MNYEQYFQSAIDNLKKENNYREFVDIARICGRFPYAKNASGKEIVVWCSNDYLGLGQNPLAIEAVCNSVKEFGIGSGGTRNISGTNSPLVLLEKEMANLHQKESAIVFSSGYVANEAAIKALSRIIPNLVIFSDQKNHASIIYGIKNSGLKKHIFRHNDLKHLEELLAIYDKSQPKLIIFESVYSMDGDFGKIDVICDLAQKYQALTFIDEVHGVGLYGEDGAGLAGKLQLNHKIDFIQATFGKAYGGIGGYIAGNSTMIDAIRSFAPGFIFTTAMPPMMASALLVNVRYLRQNNDLRVQHQDKVKKLKSLLKASNIKIMGNESHIISIIIGDAALSKKVSIMLLQEYGIYVQNINFPTVDIGSERLRIVPTPLHSDEMINDLVKALKEIFIKLNIN